MGDILKKIRKLNWMLQESPTGAFSFNEMCELMSEFMDANVYITNRHGKVIGVGYKSKSDSMAISDTETGSEVLPEEYNEELMRVRETTANLSGDEALRIFKYDYDTADKLHTIIPILGGGQRWGTLVLTRYSPSFEEEDLVIGEYGATIVGMEIQRRKSLEREEEEREIAMVQMAIGTLSYSEIEAVQQIFAELDGDEGLLVASKIADRSGITRSVIVNALRKLESAGVVESRSLGMKGTRIKITNSKFKDELNKMTI
ncbi:MAG: GTP-sensing pleiotropic transcriptional regulator CodY [Anaerovoracaceae bacterium]|uniref:GTP-sensing pleiotropic transcriptional regulator CodY n=1 Tax=Gallibacter sp. Marseille-QA0791 TaxID=3378781 RepID=UPI003A4C026B